MARKNRASIFALLSLVAAALSLIPTDVFAQSKASKKSVESVGSVIKEVTHIRDQVHAAIGSLTALTSGEDAKLRKHFKAYSKSVNKMSKAQKSVKDRVEDMQVRRAAYRQEWEKEMEAVQNPDIKAHMQQRKEEVGRTMDRAQPAAQAAREAFPPFLQNLQDVQKMLSVDLSRSGVAAATPIAHKAIDEGNGIIASLDTMISALSELKAQISPTGK